MRRAVGGEPNPQDYEQKKAQLTVIVVAQSSIHTSDALLEKREEWQERHLSIFELPSYSPELTGV